MFLIIAGHPATGKTTLTRKLEERFPDHKVFHTDDYMDYGYKESLYKLMEDISIEGLKLTADIIVEGVMGTRLMRKLQENGNSDLVSLYVYLRGTPRLIEETYTRERPNKDLKQIASTCKGIDTVNASIDKTPNEHTLFLDLEIDKYDELDLSKLNI